MSEHEPILAIFDKGEELQDRYTIVIGALFEQMIPKKGDNPKLFSLVTSATPDHPQSYCHYWPYTPGENIGRMIADINELPSDVIEKIKMLMLPHGTQPEIEGYTTELEVVREFLEEMKLSGVVYEDFGSFFEDFEIHYHYEEMDAKGDGNQEYFHNIPKLAMAFGELNREV